MQNSNSLASEASALVSTYAPFPFVMESAEGVWVNAKGGKRYLDFYGGHAVSLLGHSRPELVEAIAEQGRKLYFYSTLGDIQIRERAAKGLIDYCDSDLKKVFFCNSGAEANENALKLCLQKRGSASGGLKRKLVGFKKGWHGRSLLCMSVTDDPSWHQSMPGWFGPTAWAELNDIESLKVIDETTAGVILEPIQSIGGVREADPAFLRALRARCTEVGAWLIFDEIQTGLGRTGVPFVSGSKGVTDKVMPDRDSNIGSSICPDMMTLAKGLGSGYPIGALVMTEGVASTINGADLGSTFGGGPMAMAVLETSLRILREEKLSQHAAAIGNLVKESLVGVPLIEEVRGRGCLLGLKLNCSAKELQLKLLDRGILIGTSGDPSVARLLPPLVIKPEHVEMLVKAIREL